MANNVDQTVPLNSESPTLGAQRIRETRSGFNEILTVEHDISDSATTKGFHGTNVTGKVDSSISTPPSGYGRFGWKTISGVAELFYRDDAGNEKQITTAGKLNISATEAVLLTGNQTIAGVKTFSSIPVLPGSNPTTGNQATRKTYTDAAPKAQMKADTVAGATYGAASESKTDANGFILKTGTATVGAGTTAVKTFANAFPGGIKRVVVTMTQAADHTFPVRVTAKTASNFTLKNPNGGSATVDWIAVGY